MKKITLTIAITLLLAAGSASAQSYYTSTACANISRDLSIGSRGNDVLVLQRFLLSRNYPGSGAWMLTGYYGQATAAAVRIFQQEQGLPISGWVDSNTRMAIDRSSCGNYGVYQPNYVYTSPYNYSFGPYNNNYLQNGNYGYQYGNQYQQLYSYNYNLPTGQAGNYGFYPYNNYASTVSITSLSSNSGYPGTSITIYGSGFDYGNNTVYFGTTRVNAYSSNANTLTVTVPANLYGTVQVYVQNSRGTSNNLPFTISNNYSNYYDNNGCGNYYGNCCQSTYGQACPLQISYLNPNSGAVGSSVTVIGSGFSATGNTVRFGIGIITGLSSPDGRSVSFIVPTQLSGYGSQIVTIGQYAVSVTNATGQTSNTLPFNVTSASSNGTPIITSVSGPTVLSVNTNGTWTLTVNNQGSNYVTASVNWGDPVYGTYASAPQQVYGSGTQTVSFSHTYSQSGTFTIVFTVNNANGQSNTSSVTVNVH